MGAGAGYTLEVSDFKFLRIASISPQDVKIQRNRYGDLVAVVKCDVNLFADVKGSSYYYSSDVIRAKVVVTEAEIRLGFGEYYNGDLLTQGAIGYYENKYDRDIDDINYKYLENEVTADQIDLTYLKDVLSNEYNYDGTSDVIGAGYVHANFDGEFSVSDLDSRSGYNELLKYTAFISDDAAIEYLDHAVLGDFEDDDDDYSDDDEF